MAGADRDGQLDRAEAGGGSEHRQADREVLSGAPDVQPGRGVDMELDEAVGEAGPLVRDDGVRAGREDRAGRDADRARPIEGPRGRRPGERLTDDAERPAGRAGGDREPVHRAVGERRDVDPGDQGAREDPPERVGHGDDLGRARPAGFEDAVAGDLERDWHRSSSSRLVCAAGEPRPGISGPRGPRRGSRPRRCGRSR